MNSSANDFVDPVAAYEATKVDTDFSSEVTTNAVQAASTEDPMEESGQRRKSSRIRHNMILEAENQLKRQKEMELEAQNTTPCSRRRKSKKSLLKTKEKLSRTLPLS